MLSKAFALSSVLQIFEINRQATKATGNVHGGAFFGRKPCSVRVGQGVLLSKYIDTIEFSK